MSVTNWGRNVTRRGIQVSISAKVARPLESEVPKAVRQSFEEATFSLRISDRNFSGEDRLIVTFWGTSQSAIIE
jgi:hypothetical protein